MSFPYVDNDDNTRTLFCEKNSEEFVWHRDQEDRTITVLSGEGWRLQYNGSLPVEMIEGKCYHIPAMMYHRVFKGCTDLRIHIQK